MVIKLIIEVSDDQELQDIAAALELVGDSLKTEAEVIETDPKGQSITDIIASSEADKKIPPNKKNSRALTCKGCKRIRTEKETGLYFCTLVPDNKSIKVPVRCVAYFQKRGPRSSK